MNFIQSFAAGVAANIVVAANALLGVPQQRETDREGGETDRERGDVPGWVLITLMTAGLVTILWKLAGDQLAALFTAAMSSVTGP